MAGRRTGEVAAGPGAAWGHGEQDAVRVLVSDEPRYGTDPQLTVGAGALPATAASGAPA